jgi:hypothetical protein
MADLTVSLTANITDFKRGLNEAQAQMKTSVGKMKEGWGDLSKTLKHVTVAVTAASGAIYALAKSTANVGDQFQKLSIRTGASTEFLSEIAHAAELSDVSLSDLEVAFRKLAMTMGDADQGLSTATEAFKSLGIEIYNTSENRLKSIEEIFPELVDAFNKIEDETLKTARAVDIFGRSGTALLPLIAEGTDGIKTMREEAKALGLVWSKDATDAAAKFNDDLTRLQYGLKGIRNEIGQALFPILNEWIVAGTEKIKDFIANDLPGHMAKLRVVLPEVAKEIKEFAEGIAEVVKWVFDHGDLAKTLLEIAVAIKAVSLAISASKIVTGMVGMAGAFATASKAILAFMTGPAGIITLGVAGAIAGIGLACKSLKTEIDASFSSLDELPSKFDKIGTSAFNNRLSIDDFTYALRKMGENKIADKIVAGVQLTDNEINILEESLRRTGYQIEKFGTGKTIEIVTTQKTTKETTQRTKPFVSFPTDIMAAWTKESISEMQTWQKATDESLNQMANSYSTFDERYKNTMSSIIENTELAKQTLSGGEFALDISPFEDSISEIPKLVESVKYNWSDVVNQWSEDNAEYFDKFQDFTSQLSSTMEAYTEYELTLLDNSTKKKITSANKEANARIEAVNKALAGNKISEESAANQIAIIRENLANKITKIEDDANKKQSEIRKKQKPYLIAEAVANTAIGVTKALAQGGILGIVTGALVAAAGAIQIATIEAQQFAKGGIVKVLYRNSGSDTVPAMLTPGEGILTRKAVQKIGGENVVKALNAQAGGIVPNNTNLNILPSPVEVINNQDRTVPSSNINNNTPVYITIQTLDTESMDRYLRGNGRQPMIDFVNREKRMRTI